MGKVVSSIDDSIRGFIAAQQLFFVATAPLDINGHINVSPKGLDTFRVLGPSTVAYLDLTGSGVETIAHVRENRRIVIMFCAFHGQPKILRLHGKATIHEPRDTQYADLLKHFPAYDGVRSIVLVEVSRISTSCGFGVPLLSYESEREQLPKWCKGKGTEGLEIYRQEKNRVSIDDLPGVSR